MPQVCPLGAPQENSTTAFAYTRTVVWAYANGCSGIRKRLFGHTQTVITLCQTPCNSVPFSCFRDTYFFKKGLLGAPRGHLRGTLLGPWCPLQHTCNQRISSNRGTGGTLFSCFSHGIYYGEGWMVKGEGWNLIFQQSRRSTLGSLPTPN